MDSFSHLHVHSMYSMLDGAAQIDPLLAEVKRLGMSAVAITDHGNLFGAAEFYRKSRETEITPILGIEAYLAPESRYHKRPVLWGGRSGGDEFAEGGDVSGAGAYTHMTLLAENATGLRNLFRLSSRASFEGFYRKSRCDRELLAEYAQGVIATTGCPGGEVSTRLRLGQHREALQAAADFRDIFGPQSFFLELMDHGITGERSIRDGLLEIGRMLKLQPLATNDSHYVSKGDASAHSALLCVQTARTLDDPKRFRFEGSGYYLKSAQEMRGYWDTEVPGACDATLAIAARVGSYDEVFAHVNRMPRWPLSEGQTADAVLAGQVAAQTRFAELPQNYRERVDAELSVITAVGYADYFLVVGDLVRWAKSVGIRCGAGRGSAAGSLVAYLLHITDIDPIEHGLIFERFLNLDRFSPPDIDLDFDKRRRGEVLDYLTTQYGQANVAQIITVNTIHTRAALRDAARVHYGVPGVTVAERIIRTLPPTIHAKDIPLAAITDESHERYPEAAAVRELVAADTAASQVLATAGQLEGIARNVGVHACGVIVSAEPLLDVLPLWRTDDTTVTGWDLYECERIGLLKLDCLGLRNLTVVDDCLAAISAHWGVDVDLDALELDDAATYDLLASGHTLGVFQLDSPQIRDLLRRVKPDVFADITAVVALYRPGPMGANAHLEYADRKNGVIPATPIHPELADALSEVLAQTYQLCVFQEDAMAIAVAVAGFSLNQADILRWAMGKKKLDKLIEQRELLASGMREHGYSDDAIDTLWNTLLPFADYAFCRAHAACYALLAYHTAYLKAHYPVEYMAALLSSVRDDPQRTALYLSECRRLSIKVLPPDVNASQAEFTATAEGIRFGLAAVRNVGANAVAAVAAARAEGSFGSFADFLDRVDLSCLTSRVVESLSKAGAFDSLGHTRASLVAACPSAVEIARRHAGQGGEDLFGGSPLDGMSLATPEWPPSELLSHEREMLGRYVSGHPLDGIQDVLSRHTPIAELVERKPSDGASVRVVGVVTEASRRVSKAGNRWMLVTLEDLDTQIDILVFGTAYAVLPDVLVSGAVVVVSGRARWREDTMAVQAFEATAL